MVLRVYGTRCACIFALPDLTRDNLRLFRALDRLHVCYMLTLLLFFAECAQ